jgi:hypothetical protein
MIIEAAFAAMLVVNGDIIDRAAHLPPAQVAYRDCVAQRESKHDPRAHSATSSAAGKFQFLENKWHRGLSHMVAEKLREEGATKSLARTVRKHLRTTPIHRWHEAYQDVAFAAVLNANGPWSGAKHWAYGGYCDTLVRR